MKTSGSKECRYKHGENTPSPIMQNFLRATNKEREKDVFSHTLPGIIAL